MTNNPTDTLPRICLSQGQVCFTREACWISTVLGPCVAITLFAPKEHAAAMCHAVFPSPKTTREKQSYRRDPGRWIVGAVPSMIDCFREIGVPLTGLQAKVFGGADVMSLSRKAASRLAIGPRNVECALQELRQLGLSVLVAHVGGHQGRSILFNTVTGEVLLRCLPKSCQSRLEGKEDDSQ